jgi:ferredoxin
MAKLKIENFGEYEVEDGKRLLVAIEDLGIDILHRCGGFARCTTCRVEFLEGEPQVMTVAERDKWIDKGEEGFRLSCQCRAEGEMHFRVVKTLQSEDMDDPGPTPEKKITPEPEWIDLQRG